MRAVSNSSVLNCPEQYRAIVYIGADLAKEIHLSEGTEVDLAVIDGSLTIKLRSRKRYSLNELIDGTLLENIHAEIDSGIAVGNEVW